jgi:hypothetical protein
MEVRHRALAAAVLNRAISDAYGIAAATPERRSARRFLRPHARGLQFWCTVLDLDPRAFCVAAHKNGPDWVRKRGGMAGRARLVS